MRNAFAFRFRCPAAGEFKVVEEGGQGSAAFYLEAPGVEATVQVRVDHNVGIFVVQFFRVGVGVDKNVNLLGFFVAGHFDFSHNVHRLARVRAVNAVRTGTDAINTELLTAEKFTHADDLATGATGTKTAVTGDKYLTG